jgi:hypothetical protein
MLDKPSVQLYNTRYHKEKQTMRIDVLDVVDREDGGANIIIDMDEKSTEQFARIGIIKVLTDAAEHTEAYHDQTDSRQLELEL